jgi:hypothetical protein
VDIMHSGSETEDFIERSLRERRSLQGALADMMTKYSRIPPGGERKMLERMIEGLRVEIDLRNSRVRFLK